MTQTIINTAVTFIVSSILGYSVSVIRNYNKKLKENKEESKLLKEALVSMLQSNLTNTFYVYENTQQIPDYIYRNWLNSKKIYEQLGGNDYIHVLAEKMKKWDFEKTDILKKRWCKWIRASQEKY